MLLTFAQATTEDEPGTLAVFIVTWAPILLILLLGYWTLKKTNDRTKQIQQREFEHFDRVEAKTEEMVELLREIRNSSDGKGT